MTAARASFSFFFICRGHHIAATCKEDLLTLHGLPGCCSAQTDRCSQQWVAVVVFRYRYMVLGVSVVGPPSVYADNGRERFILPSKPKGKIGTV